MQTYKDKLTDFYKNKSSFYDFCRYRRRIQRPDKTPSDVIVHLDGLNYNFTQPDFNNFIINATYQRRNSFIANIPVYDRTNWKRAIEIMFTKFTPTAKQIEQLFSCYSPAQTSNSQFVWVDTLITKGYIFNDDQKQQLAQFGYNMVKMYNGGVTTIDELKNVIVSVIKQKTDTTELKNFVKNNAFQYDDTFINWLILQCSGFAHHNFTLYSDMLNIFFNNLYINIKDINDKLNGLLIKNKSNIDTIYYFLERGIIPNKELMDYCLTLSNGTINILFMCVKHKMQITPEMLNTILRLPNGHHPLNHVRLDKLGLGNCQGWYGTFKLTPFIIQHHLEPNELVFEHACKVHDIGLFDYCINEYKMIPMKKHLIIALSNASYNEQYISFINKILCYKIIPDSDCIKFLNHLPTVVNSNYYDIHCKPIINLLIKFGYKPTVQDIGLMLEKNIKLDNLEHLGIKFDDNFYYISHTTDNWQYDDKFKLANEKVLGLRQLCRKGESVDEIKLYITTNDVKLDGYCLEHAIHNNMELADWMIEEFNCQIPVTSHYWMGKRVFDSAVATQVKSKELYHKILKSYKIDDTYLSTPIH